MNIDKAAWATRAFFYSSWNGLWDAKVWQVFTSSEHVAASKGFSSRAEAQAACDRLNLLAVLEAIREPSEAAVRAGYDAFEDGYVAIRPRLKAVIDALIAEVKNR